MFLTILLVIVAVGFVVPTLLLIGQTRDNKKLFEERDILWAQIRNESDEHRQEATLLKAQRDEREAEVKRLTNKLIQVQNHSTLVEEDSKARIDEFKKLPIIACMTDNQVHILAEMLAVHVRQILEIKKEWVN